MQFLDINGVKRFKRYTDDTFITSEDITTVEDATFDNFYTKTEIDNIVSDLETEIGSSSSSSNTVTESTVSGWGFTKNTGTVTQVKVGSTAYDPSSGVVSLPAYPTTLPASDVSAWAKASTKPTYTASEVGALPSTTAIPTKTSELTNDSGFLTSHQSLSGYATETYVDNAIEDLIGTAPDALDTLGEIADALNDDANLASTLTTQITAKYTKPSTGIPSSDLASSVTTSLNKADTALQSETDPIFSASAAASITSSDITNWNNKTSNTGTITGITMNGASKGTSGVVDLGTVLTSHQDISGKANDSAVVHNTGAETIAGLKTFSNGITTSGTITTRTLVVGGQEHDALQVQSWGSIYNVNEQEQLDDYINSAISGKATDTSVVHLTGAETITGNKTFNGSIYMPDPSSISFTDTNKGLDEVLDSLQRAITISSSEPTSSQGSDGDIWIVI